MIEQRRSLLDLGPITSPYGDAEGRQVPHNGVDIGVPVGTAVPTQVGGQVTRTLYDRLGGLQLIVRTPQGYEEVFAHLQSIGVSIGDVLEPGQLIGYSGASGTVTGPHLHYEVRPPSGQGTVDPFRFLAEFVPGFASEHPTISTSGSTSSAPSAPDACAAVPAAVVQQVRDTLNKGITIIGGAVDPKATADSIRAEFPNVPLACLQQLVYGQAKDVRVAPSGIEQAGEAIVGLTKNLTDPRKWAQLAFTAAGVGLIIVGVLLYTRSLTPAAVTRIVKEGEA